jgi:selenium metabolism protein YedF
MTKSTKENELPNPAAEASPSSEGTVLFIASDILGRGEDRSLGILILQSFLNTVNALPTKPETIVLMNNGVKLATEGSAVLGELKTLESQGIDILACGTCLSRFQLTDKVAVGQISNMNTLAGILLRATKVISL